MRKLFLAGLTLAAMTMLFSSCNQFKKMQKNVQSIETKSNPEVLMLQGNTVDADLTVTFPEKYFAKDVILKVTPVLTYEGGEIAGAPKYFQGEKVEDNYTAVPNKEGGSYTFPMSLPYDCKASLSTLELRVEGRQPEKESRSEFAPFGVLTTAQGVSTVQLMAQPYTKILPNKFERITTVTKEADIHYAMNSSKVNKSQLTQEQVKLFEEFIKENQGKENVAIGNIQAKGYASPEGPEKFNDKLADNRSKAGEKAIMTNLKGMDVQYSAVSFGEDWDGFKALVEASDIADKDLILSVLSMYDSAADRDREIKNLSVVYNELKETILPELRRTTFAVTAEFTGYSDEQLSDLICKGDTSLNVEEMLYAATLVEGKDKVAAYQLAAKQYGDARAYNNLAVVLLNNGDVEGARTAIDKAKAGINEYPCIHVNLAAVAIAEADYAAAKECLAKADCPEAKKNVALLAMFDGDYATAVKGLDGYNLAVAQVLNGNYAAAKVALGNEKCPYSDYLKAIISMREGNSQNAIANLKSAISQCECFKAKAEKDIEFAKLFGTAEFEAL